MLAGTEHCKFGLNWEQIGINQVEIIFNWGLLGQSYIKWDQIEWYVVRNTVNLD